MSETPYKFKCVNIRLKMDDMCIPHIESAIFTDDMSGVKDSFMNITAYCKAKDDLTTVVARVENYILSIKGVTVEHINFDWKQYMTDPSSTSITDRIMTGLRLNIVKRIPEPPQNFPVVPRQYPIPAQQQFYHPRYNNENSIPNTMYLRLNPQVDALMQYLETHPVNAPDFAAKTKKGVEKINNFIRNVLNISFTPDESKYISSEILKRRPIVI